MFASNLLISLSGLGHSTTPWHKSEKVMMCEFQIVKILFLTYRCLALILCNNSTSIPMQAEGITRVFRSVSPSSAAVYKTQNIIIVYT